MLFPLIVSENKQFEFNPSLLVNDPYPIYRAIRENSPVTYVDSLKAYLISRYDDCKKILSNVNFLKHPINHDTYLNVEKKFLSENYGKYPKKAEQSILTLNPPDHTRLRSLVTKAFTPRMVESLRPFVQSITTNLMDKNTGESFDMISSIAAPVPAYVIAKMMGVPDSDRDKFKQLSDDLILSLDPSKGEEAMMKSTKASYELASYFNRLIKLKTKEPEDDLISSLIKVKEADGRISDPELISMCVLVLSAGHETTTNLIGNGFYTLLRNREQMEILKNDPTVLKNGIEEMLRYESPVQLTSRIAPEDNNISGVDIKKGIRLIALIGSANRDPDANEDPDAFNVERKNIKHISFSEGIHFCLGTPLARMEAEIVFNLLLERYSEAKIAVEPKWKDNMTMRGLESLVIKP